MERIPKIALARMKAKPEAGKAREAPVGSPLWQGAEHPDANLLTAFVEKSLTERERTQVLDHFSRCAECREIAALTLPPQEMPAESAAAAAARHWNPWLVLRWGAMAAVLGAAAMVVVLHPGVWQRSREMSREATPSAPADNNVNRPLLISPAPPSPAPPSTAEAKAHLGAEKSAAAVADLRKALETAAGKARDEQLASAKPSQQAPLMAAAPQAGMARGANASTELSEREDKKQLSSRVLPAPPPAAPAAVSTGVSEDAVKAKDESQAGQMMAHSITRSVEATGSGGGYGPAPGAAPKASPLPSTQAGIQVSAAAPLVAMRASGKGAEFGAARSSALWNISSSGEVQRSLDGGKSFLQIRVAPGVKFLVVAALGDEVWAGGAEGALFHSTDGGATWNHVAINVDGNAINEAISGIQILDLKHLTITSSSGSRWASEDGGQRWEK